MKCYNAEPSAAFQQVERVLKTPFKVVELSVYRYPYRLKGALCGMSVFKPRRRRITVLNNLCKLQRRLQRLLGSEFDDVFRNAPRKLFLT